MTPRKERLSVANNIFPYSSSKYTTALSEEPVLLNGMKVIFDQSAAVYPVSLQLKDLSTQYIAQLSGQNRAYAKPFANGRVRSDNDAPRVDARVGNFDEITVQTDWKNEDVTARIQYRQDIKLWLNTIYPPVGGVTRSEANTEKSKIIQRIFSLLHFGGLRYRTSDENDNWQQWDKPIAAALSHGGRVLICVGHRAYGQVAPHPDYQHKHRIWNWLVAGQFEDTDKPVLNAKAKFETRTAATHATKFDKEKGPYEKKLNQIQAIQSGHYGMNIPLGGENGENALGESIKADGKHGHLYFRYDAAPDDDDNWDCAIMIGCETTRPPMFDGEPGTGHLGTTHSWWGSAQSISATGGNKWEDIVDENSKPGKINCVRLDIDDINTLLEISTFGEKQVLPEDSDLRELIQSYTQDNVAIGYFEHDSQRYREVVKDWLRFQPASGELF